MNDDKFKKIYNSIGHENYEKMRWLTLLAATGITSYNLKKGNDALELVSSGLDILFILTTFYPKKFSSNDVKKNDPVEIFTMFDYLLNNGYLSNDKHYEWFDDGTKDVNKIQGANVLTGYAVCRHNSEMLRDILNEKGIKACQLNVYCKSDKLDLVKKIVGNHSITYACNGINSYFFDPTNSVMFEKDKNKLFNEKYNIIFGYRPSIKQYLQIKDTLKYPVLEKEKSNEISSKTKMICINNIDRFERFYEDNKEIYKEVADKAYTLKR